MGGSIPFPIGLLCLNRLVRHVISDFNTKHAKCRNTGRNHDER